MHGAANMLCTIYALAEAGSDAIRYIGKTTQPLKKRLYGHLYNARRGADTNRHKTHWIAQCDARGIKIEAKVLEIVPASEQDAAEIKWITASRNDGQPLTNLSDGGGGGVNPSLEVRAKVSAAHKGIRKKPESVEKYTITMRKLRADGAIKYGGWVHTEATRQKLCATWNERREDRSGENNHQSKLTEDVVWDIYLLYKAKAAPARAIAMLYDVHLHTVEHIVYGKSWKHLKLLEVA